MTIEFANIRQPKVLHLDILKKNAIEAFSQRFAEDAEMVALGFALKLSISGSNLDRMVPMTIKGHNVSSETFISCVKPHRGQDSSEVEMTVSRFCASLAGDISKYLDNHPKQVRTVVTGVPAKLSFPHNYYVKGLSTLERQACIVWLKNHDDIMSKVTNGKWRDLSLKAVAYFVATGQRLDT